jgi:hypothetical protein
VIDGYSIIQSKRMKINIEKKKKGIVTPCDPLSDATI